MDATTLEQLKKFNDKIVIMQAELTALKSNSTLATDNRAMYFYAPNMGREVHIEKIPDLKKKIYDLILSEYEKEYDRLYREYVELTICKPNGKVTNYKPANLNEL